MDRRLDDGSANEAWLEQHLLVMEPFGADSDDGSTLEDIFPSLASASALGPSAAAGVTPLRLDSVLHALTDEDALRATGVDGQSVASESRRYLERPIPAPPLLQSKNTW